MNEDDGVQSSDRSSRLTRRSFLGGSASFGAAVPLSGGVFVTGDGKVSSEPWLHGTTAKIEPPSTDAPRPWLGPALWGNRLQDWRSVDGRIECLRGDAGDEMRTVAVLTRELVSGDEPAHLRTVTGIAGGDGGDGFAGVLLGIGGGDLDYRAAALAGRSSGEGGGFLCTYEADGRVRFREHVDEAEPVSYDVIPADASGTTATAGDPATGDGVELAVDVLPRPDGRFDVLVRAFAAEGGQVLARAVRRDVPGEAVLGGMALVSSPPPGEAGTRWWFDGLETGGPKVATHPDRTFGPIVGTLFSLDDEVLKLSAQLFPMAATDPTTVELHYRPAAGGEDRRTESAEIGDGHVASFRIEEWDDRRAWEYRVEYRDGSGGTWQYPGRIPADPGTDDDLTIGLLSCTSASGRRLDAEAPQGALPGRYTTENIYVPYETLTRNLRAHDPDLLVCVGDQYYETRPTDAADREDPELDLLYRWFLWHWSFRDLTRETPTIVLVDDHDVYQGNLWGSGGDAVPSEDRREGGYLASAEAVNRMQHVQCWHDPDPYDPTPVERGIDVYYGAFTFGGTRFAMLEDRKFKTGPAEVDDGEGVLLGDRQERFLEDWAAQGEDEPHVCLTQTILAGAVTTREGDPQIDPDTNGFPSGGRDRAVRLLREAGALVLAGDQHLPTLVRHGVEDPTDGVVQFTGPAGGALFGRWFEPASTLPNGRGRRFTGEFVDAFGNPLRVLAVANPDAPHRTFDGPDEKPKIYERDRRSDGYGIVRVDHANEEFVVECWPRTADPSAGPGGQFPGWPYRLPFAETDGRDR